jgi:hypothetical protein
MTEYWLRKRSLGMKDEMTILVRIYRERAWAGASRGRAANADIPWMGARSA